MMETFSHQSLELSCPFLWKSGYGSVIFFFRELRWIGQSVVIPFGSLVVDTHGKSKVRMVAYFLP